MDEGITEEVLSHWRSRRRVRPIAVRGSSMDPLLRPGDTIEVRFGDGPVKRGDIVLFRRDGRWIAHRVIARRSRGGSVWLLEKGDRSSRASWIPLRAVHGTALRILRGDRVLHLDRPAARRAGRLAAGLSLAGLGWSRALGATRLGRFLSRVADALRGRLAARLPGSRR